MNLGNGVEINFGKLTDEQLHAVRTEVNAAGEARGLWIPEGAGQIAVAQTIDIDAERLGLLVSVREGACLFNEAIEAINSGRKKKDQIAIIEPGEYRERAEDWLTDERIVTASVLPETADRPRMIFPRLHQPISIEENLTAWDTASDSGLYRWSDQLEFLSNWTADQLSGYDPGQEDDDRLTVIPTAYEEDREGTVPQQVETFEAITRDYPELDVTTIFEGSLLARRYKGQRYDWKDSYVRGITLKPTEDDRFDYVPSARVSDGGDARVDDSDVQDVLAARLQVR